MAYVVNSPDLWRVALPRPTATGHKYDRGHAVIAAAPELTGASRLAVSACTRIGAGLVTAVAEERADVYRTCLPADVMVSSDLAASRRRVTAALIGPGGVPKGVAVFLETLEPGVTLVVDAGGLGVRTDLQGRHANRVLTPHDGEFRATFPHLQGDAATNASAAADEQDAIVVLKGPETIVAAPDGRVVRNTHCSPYLAKAGTGDVLAGMITGLAAQGMNPFQASCAAVWMHGEIARRFGPGLVPDDLIDGIPAVLASLLES